MEGCWVNVQSYLAGPDTAAEVLADALTLAPSAVGTSMDTVAVGVSTLKSFGGSIH